MKTVIFGYPSKKIFRLLNKYQNIFDIYFKTLLLGFPFRYFAELFFLSHNSVNFYLAITNLPIIFSPEPPLNS